MCREYGVSYSHFLGGPVRWTDEDRDKARAVEIHLRSRCPECGTFDDDWRDPVTRRALAEPRWMPTSHRCEGCRTIAEERADIPDGEKGVFVGLIPWVDLELVDALHPGQGDGGWAASAGVDDGDGLT